MAKPKEAECPKCGYSWYTKSRKDWIGCPSCQRKSKKGEVLQE